MSGIDILPTDDQLEIVAGLTKALDDVAVAGADASLVAELGFIGAGLSEEAGGLGLGVADETLLNIEYGRRLAGVEILAANLAARLAAGGGDPDLAAALIAGQRKAGFVSPMAGWSQADAGPRGEVHLVGDADVWLALSPAGGAILRAADLTAPKEVESMDAVAPAARAAIVGAPAWSDAGEVSIWAVATLSFAAQMAGLAAAARDMGAEYAKVRVQFDKPIGSFQGIAHPLADCAVRAEAAYNQALYAAIALRDGRPDALFQATAACLTAMDAAFRNATTNIQTHGAMGYSSITGAHLYIKRAVVLRHLAGGTRLHERAMLEVTAPAI